MKTRANQRSMVVLAASFIIGLSIQAVAQKQTISRSGVQPNELSSMPQATAEIPETLRPVEILRFVPGLDTIVEGVILGRGATGFVLRDRWGRGVLVNLVDDTKVIEKKSNPFRGPRKYSKEQLLRGLEVTVYGHGNSSGSLEADEIRFTQDDLRIAGSLDFRVDPVEARLEDSEANARRLAHQVAELALDTGAAVDQALDAQEAADRALEWAQEASDAAWEAQDGVQAVNERISSMDDFDVKKYLLVFFGAGSSFLSKEAKSHLDTLAGEIRQQRGFIVEVTGFASSDGNETLNRELSRRRADAVIRYLAEKHRIPLRRFVNPFGFGEKLPIADNMTHDGRLQNRRAEVRVLVSKAMVEGVADSSF